MGYQQFARSGPGRFLVRRLGLPNPVQLRRYEPGAPVTGGPVLLGGAPGGRLLEPVGKLLAGIGVDVQAEVPEGERPAALVFDATGIGSSEALRGAYEFFHPVLRRLDRCGRVIVLGTAPADCADPREATAQRALGGLVRSIGKEVGRGATAALVYVAPGAEGAVESTLRFLLSGRSAYVSGQVIRIGPAEVETPADWERPLAGRVALVTGAARGIGEAIAGVLARDGAHVVCLDVPAQGDALATVANRCVGSTLQVDITAPDAPTRIAAYLAQRHGGVDIVVHNAGVTRDKRLANMRAEQWDQVLGINLTAQERIDDALLDGAVLRAGGPVVTVSSILGLAGPVALESPEHVAPAPDLHHVVALRRLVEEGLGGEVLDRSVGRRAVEGPRHGHILVGAVELAVTQLADPVLDVAGRRPAGYVIAENRQGVRRRLIRRRRSLACRQSTREEPSADRHRASANPARIDQES